MTKPRSPWQRYVDAAVTGQPPSVGPADTAGGVSLPARSAADRHRYTAPGRFEGLRERLQETIFPLVPAPGPEATRRRTDVRLVPSALLVWGAAVAGSWLEPAALAGICLVLLACSALLLLRVSARAAAVARAGVGPGAVVGSGAGATPREHPRRRSALATLAVALLLSAAAGAHGAVASSQRHDGAVAGAVAARAAVVAELEVVGTPRRLRAPGSSGLADRWAVPATLLTLDFGGRRILAGAKLLVLGGAEWEHTTPGQRIRTTGKLKPPEPGQAEAAILAASSAPRTARAPGPWQRGPGELRTGFTAAASRLDGDARGLLPGMVTGDTSALDPQLDAAMKTVGMTHLTAVSGANCSIILGSMLFAARSLRLKRTAAAAVCLAGLGMFVLMVGPDASVLRAAVMGAVGLMALAGGRTGRGLSFLCLAVIGLLLAEPALSTSFGFLLSVLATLGIVVAGRPIMTWFPAAVPRWAAAGLAVPLAAQTFCGPVIVLLQPQFSSYALPANVVAAALVAPVTLLGTAAVPLVALLPAAAAVPLGIAAVFAGGVGGVARFFASLPGAVLPWPEGGFGVATMALLSGVVLAAAWLAFHPAAAVCLAVRAHTKTVDWLEHTWPPGARRHSGPERRRRGLVDRSGRGTLRVCKRSSGRKREWLLPRPNAPGRRRRRRPPGVM
ncbi:ComEC/Rec2 family competence protein [Arthrobacter sp. CG_A4]|uniref:ComEC/Rec2 family competence protein n=1 Tax=Arthrobacter sp. CG_A4 TaxID=3071706 RepID=UPI002DFA376C|nr:competence protein ComEC [Arthrobacter sp. CG_A4]